jgi:hypothetical protein
MPGMTRARWIAMSGLVYGAICLMFVLDPRLVGFVLKPLPQWLVLTTLGPALLLGLGDGAGKAFFGIIGLLAACLAGSWLC